MSLNNNGIKLYGNNNGLESLNKIKNNKIGLIVEINYYEIRITSNINIIFFIWINLINSTNCQSQII